MAKLFSALCALVLVGSACGSSSSDGAADGPQPASEVEQSEDQPDPPDDADDATSEASEAPDEPDEPNAAEPGTEAEEPVELPADDEVVLSVNGNSLTGAELSSELDEWAAAFVSDETATVRAGDGFAPSFVAFVLTQHVQLSAVEQAAAALGYESDEGHRTAAAEALDVQLPDLPPDGVIYGRLLGVQAILLALEPTDDQIAEYFDANSEQFPPVLCSRHILHDTADDAEATLARLDDGEDFADLAAEVSTGPSGPNGGDLGCEPEGSFVPEFESAAYIAGPGEVVGPVETQFGFHVIEVLSIGPPELDDVRDQIVNDLAADATAPLSEAVVGATVEIDPALGAWDPATGQVSLAG